MTNCFSQLRQEGFYPYVELSLDNSAAVSFSEDFRAVICHMQTHRGVRSHVSHLPAFSDISASVAAPAVSQAPRLGSSDRLTLRYVVRL